MDDPGTSPLDLKPQAPAVLGAYSKVHPHRNTDPETGRKPNAYRRITKKINRITKKIHRNR